MVFGYVPGIIYAVFLIGCEDINFICSCICANLLPRIDIYWRFGCGMELVICCFLIYAFVLLACPDKDAGARERIENCTVFGAVVDDGGEVDKVGNDTSQEAGYPRSLVLLRRGPVAERWQGVLQRNKLQQCYQIWNR